MLRKCCSVVCAIGMLLLSIPCAQAAEPVTPQAMKVYTTLAKGTQVKIDHIGVSFKDAQGEWWVFGEVTDTATPYLPSSAWPVTKPLDILLVSDPLSNVKILPYAEPVPNTESGTTLTVQATPGEYEPASIVMRTGADALENIAITASTLVRKNGKETIDVTAIDIRVVKVWYQAGTGVARDGNAKVLTPELLLHDAGLIKADFVHQVNLVKDISTLADSDRLQPFTMPARSNQQIWFTVHVPQNAVAGDYVGEITVTAKTKTGHTTAKLALNLNVLPFTLGAPPIDSCLYYLAVLQPGEAAAYEGRWKNSSRIEQDFRDMREHGLTDVAIEFAYRRGWNGKPDLSAVEETLRLMRNAGFTGQRFLYIDWPLNERNDLNAYRNKVARIKEVAAEQSFYDVYIYGPDEAPRDQLRAVRPLFQVVHQAGANNFVATRSNYADDIEGLIDVAIIHRNSNPRPLRERNMTVWGYGVPQAGEEKPATYRDVYGIRLWADGFDGTCNYAYQSSRNAYNDWASKKWRPHNMTYPSMDGPIPTLQWEGWREGIDDTRYLAVLAKKQSYSIKPPAFIDRRAHLAQLLGSSSYPRDPKQLRQLIIKKILE